MRAFGAEIVLVPQKGGMEMARDVADKMVAEGKGVMLDQFGNPDNPLAHYEGTGPEIWRDTQGKITHFISSMASRSAIAPTMPHMDSADLSGFGTDRRAARPGRG